MPEPQELRQPAGWDPDLDRQHHPAQETSAERRFRQVVEAAPNAMVMVSRAGEIVMVNSQAERVFGYPRAELLGQPVEILVPERFRGHHPGLRATFFADPKPRPMGAGRDLYGLRKDGSEFPIEIGLNPVETDEGPMVLSAIVDITERKAAEQALRDSETAAARRFRLVVEAAPNAMVMINSAGGIVMVNAQAERVFGYPRAELLGQSVEILVPERFRRHHPGLRATFFADPKPRPMGAGRDLYGLRKDGSEFPVEIGLNPIETDEGPMVLSAIVDITERKAAEQALRDSEHRLRSLAAIVESSGDAIVSRDLDGIVTSWNKGAERIFGHAAEEMVGQPASRFAVLGQGDDLTEILNRIKRGERVHHYETMRRHKNGTTLHMSFSVSPIHDPNSRLIGAAHVGRDITAAKQAETALRESQARLQELHVELLHVSRLSAMGQLAAMVAHELNQPLTAISNYMEAAAALLGRGGDLAVDRIRNSIAGAGEQAIRAGQIIQRLRGLAMRGDGEKRIEAIPPLVKEAAELALIGSQHRAMSIKIEGELRHITVFVDKIQIQQVLLNLLRNAAEAVADQDRREIALITEAQDDSVRISVVDNGPGLPEEVRAKLFQPFVTTKQAGMGVGLSICQTIIGAHDGRLWAEPNPEGGTIFRLTLPTAPAGEQAGA